MWIHRNQKSIVCVENKTFSLTNSVLYINKCLLGLSNIIVQCAGMIFFRFLNCCYRDWL